MTDRRRRARTTVTRSATAILLAFGLGSCTAQTQTQRAQAPAPAPAFAAPPQQPEAQAAVVGGTEALPLSAAPRAVVHLGTGPARAASPGAEPAIAVAPGGDVTLNFTNADVREFVHAVVGGTLGLNYFIDPKVQGTVTVQTAKPLPRAAVLPTVERILGAEGIALVEDDGMVRITPIEGADKASQQQGATMQAASGLGVRVLPLRYVPAAELQKVLQPFVANGAALQADSAHNALIYSGTPEDIAGFADLVRTFDTDWLARMSFALVPLRAGTAQSIVDDLRQIIAGGSGEAAGAADALRLVPVERLNAILVITAEPRYLDWARAQIATLDAGSEDSAERTYIYHVQFGRAADLADVVARTFGVSVSAPASQSAQPSATANFLQSQASQAAAQAGSAATGTPGASGPTSMLGGGLTSTGTLTALAPSIGAPTPTQGGTAQGGATPPSPGSAAVPAPAPPPTPGGAVQSATSGGPPLRIVPDERNNSLVIETTPREFRRVEDALKHLDVKPMQVAIEATIAEVTLNHQLQYGLQWFFRQGNNSETFTNVTTAAPTASFPGFSYLMSGTNVQIVLNALSAITDVRVISSPELLVLNNQTAQLQVGQEVPVPVQQQQSTLTAGAPLINTISYINTGVILTVTPRANATGEVTLDIVQEVSDVASATTTGLNAPTIDERRVQSIVSVDSGKAVALGGLIQNSVTKNRNAIPILGDIPVVGALFRNDDNTTARTELLVLIEPRIIKGADDALAATQDLERRMQEIRPIPEM